MNFHLVWHITVFPIAFLLFWSSFCLSFHVSLYSLLSKHLWQFSTLDLDDLPNRTDALLLIIVFGVKTAFLSNYQTPVLMSFSARIMECVYIGVCGAMCVSMDLSATDRVKQTGGFYSVRLSFPIPHSSADFPREALSSSLKEDHAFSPSPCLYNPPMSFACVKFV